MACLVMALVLLAAGLPGQTAQAQTRMPTPGALSPPTRVLVVGGDHNYPPFSYIKDGQVTGYDNELIKAAAEMMGYKVEFRLTSWNEARDGLDNQRLDAIGGMAYSTERDKLYDFSVPTAMITFDLFIPSNLTYTSLDDARGTKIAVQKGGRMSDWIKENQFTTLTIEVDDVPQALELLSSGQCDSALLNKAQGMYFIKEMGLANVKPLGQSILSTVYGFAVRQGNEELLFQLNQGLSILKTNGEYDRIYNRWFGVYEKQESWQVLQYFVYALVGVVTLMVVMVAWSWSLRRQVGLRTAELKHSEERYRLLVEHASEGVAVICGNSVVYSNPAMAQITGYSNEKLQQIPFQQFIHPDDREMVLERYHRRIRGEDAINKYPFRILTQTDQIHWVQVNAVFIEWEGQPATLNIYTDIHDRKEAEEKLMQQVERLAALREVDNAIISSIELEEVLTKLLEQVIKQLDVDAADVLLFDPIDEFLVFAAGVGFQTDVIRLTRLRLGQSYAGHAALDRRTVHATRDEKTQLDFIINLRPEKFVEYFGLPLIAKGQLHGVLEIFSRRHLSTDRDWMSFMENLANQTAIALDNTTLYKNLQQAHLELTKAYDATIEGWAHALELRDGETQGHSQRVVELTVELARVMGITDKEALVQIRRGAFLHDIGKMSVPDRVLFKEGPLNEEEWAEMRQHPDYAYSVLKNIAFLNEALEIPYCHHERWDGSGYPRGLKGEEIPLSARIFAVVDIWDALMSDRPYRKAWPESKVIEYLQAQAGVLLDPDVVRAFLSIRSSR
ncbi:MAG TPA: transporter substrate-binding domain-containing protein [Anaerolineaceae bacterium]|nr:transporter substrate-binding domain-containing protein [Anaerolineaceae bacterium]HPN52308.1 transporter substrate-binding domain-containing protein [Anaerolineaceae bacterium]